MFAGQGQGPSEKEIEAANQAAMSVVKTSAVAAAALWAGMFIKLMGIMKTN